jgi:predicted small secreted protein
MRDSIRKISWLALLASMLFMTACNTMEGAGKDIEEAGDEIQEEANEAKDPD